MLFVLYIIVGYVSTYLLEFLLIHDEPLHKEFWMHHVPIFGYHIHHSIYGLILIFVATVFAFVDTTKILFFLGFGWGIIIRHTITDKRFVFAEKIGAY